MICILKTGQGCFKPCVMHRGWYALLTSIIITLLFFTSLPALVIMGYGTPAYAGLFINEIMADNDSTIADPEDPNSYEDWIEIYNSGNTAVAMGGMYLTDDLSDPNKWQIPAGMTIPAKGYLIFWADNDEAQGSKHTNFKLSAGGEAIGLFKADGTALDSVQFGAQLLDVSYGRHPDSAATWGFMTATPGTANSQHNAPPSITGTTRFPVSPAGGDLVWVTCTVTDDSALATVTLAYNAGSGLKNVTMHNDGGAGDALFGVQIPAFGSGTVVDYYITAKDNLDTQLTDPAGAPADTYAYIVGYVPPPLFINEFMADNDSTIEDPDDPNSYEDWIEIFNAGDSPVDMDGMCLSDDLGNPEKWQIPTTGLTIPAGGFLVFWADSDVEQGAKHASFKLSKEGGEIGLFDTNAKRNMAIDTMTFGEQSTDDSCGRMYDGKDPWVISGHATPNYENAFPVGRCTMIWTPSYSIDSHGLIKEASGCVHTIERLDPVSDRREAAYLFWGRASGQDFSIGHGGSYDISITSPFSISF